MASFDCAEDLYDVALKPRLLRTLLRDNLPDEKRSFRDPSLISRIISTVKTHKLLSEYLGESTDKKLFRDWRSVVAAWVDRVLTLASSDSPAKCWAGISLLGLTCQECSSERFLESYQAWFEKIQPHIEHATDSHMVKVAACASLADLLLRLGQFPARHGKGGLVEKLIQPSLKLLTEETPEAISEGVVHLIGIMVTLYPTAIHRHYDSAEATIISKIFSGKCSNLMLEKLAHCLAILPKSKGDEVKWCLLMQKILLFVNEYLKDAFQGLEEEKKSYEAIRLLAPPGKNPPPPLADYKSKGLDRSKRTPIVSAMMICCSEMLKNSYQVQVTLPVQSLLMLIERVLTVDGSVPRTLSFVTSLQQELLCLELPVLHHRGLDLLIALIMGMRSQILPRSAHIVRVITRYMKKCALPGLRVKVYSVVRILLMSIGAGVSKDLEHEILKTALLDLKTDNEKELPPSNTQSTAIEASVQQTKHKKRKRSSTAELLPPQHQGPSEVSAVKIRPIKCSDLKIAALQTLEALFTLGGALKLGRTEVDDLLISLATNSFDHQRPSTEELQLTALRALLASILSQVHRRPLHLSRSLELFRRGRQVTGSKVGEFCAHSVLVLDALIHPRALPLSDYMDAPPVRPSAGLDYITSKSFQSTGQKHFITKLGVPDSDDDINEAPIIGAAKTAHQALGIPTVSSDEQNQKKKSLSNGSSGENFQRNEVSPPAVVTTDKPMFAVEPQPAISTPRELRSSGPCLSGIATAEDMNEDEGRRSDWDITAEGGVVTAAIPSFDKGKGLLREPFQEEMDDYVFPDIVDEDPDSDSDTDEE